MLGVCDLSSKGSLSELAAPIMWNLFANLLFFVGDILIALTGIYLVEVYFLFGSTDLSNGTFRWPLAVFSSSSTTSLMDLQIVENKLNEATLLCH